ncbi:MAG: glycosyltransferase family 39 protein [Firmicutes bacterium]|nr:glycosyltransferase family 39 protein [Bacillota bacterium]
MTVGLVFFMGLRMFSLWAGVVAALVSAIYVPLLEINQSLLSENMFTFFVTVSAILSYFIYRRPSWKLAVGMGLAMGLATLARPTTIALPVFLLAGVWLMKREVKSVFPWLLACLVFFLVLAPWTIRNYIVFHEFVPTAYGGGAVLWAGNDPRTDGWWKPDWPEWEPIIGKARNVLERDRLLTRDAIRRMEAHPKETIILWVKKLNRLWASKVVPDQVFVVFGLVTLFLTWRRFLPIFLIILYFIVIHMVTYAIPRYRMPVMPVVFVFAAWGLLQLWQAIRRESSAGRVESN